MHDGEETLEESIVSARGFRWDELFHRMLGVSRMSTGTLLELKADAGKIVNIEALTVAVLVGLILGVRNEIAYPSDTLLSSASQILTGVFLVFVVTTIWTGLVYVIGTRVFKGTSDFGGLARPVFFSLTPAVLLGLGVISQIREIIAPIIAAWIVIINVIVLKVAMGFSGQRGMATVIVSAWIMVFILEALGLFYASP